MKEQFIWVEKYRPTLIDDIILDEDTKSQFKKYIDQKDFPHLLFCGIQGVGKTTLAKTLCNEIQMEILFVNASLEANVDLLRDKLSQFARTVSLMSKNKKCILLDEVDGVTSNAFFPALRPMIEQYSKNCVFIMTANNPEKIPDPIKSRMQIFNFQIEDNKKHALKIMKRVEQILQLENVEYDKKIIASVIQKYFPDIRKIINVMQQNSAFLKDEKLKYRLDGNDILPLIKAMKEKDFTSMKNYIINELQFTDMIYTQMFKSLEEFMIPETIPPAILILDEYQRTHPFCIDKELHLIAFCLEFTNVVKFK